MAQTQRTVAQIWTRLADNTSAGISPEDVRDGFESWRPRHGQIYVAAADAAAVTIGDTINYVEVTQPVWTFAAGDQYEFDESAGNGRLTYTGTQPIMCHIACSFSFTTANNQRLIHGRLGVSGTTNPASEAQRWASNAADVGSTAMHLVAALSNGDYVSMFVRNSSQADNVTIQVANLQLMSMPM